MRRRIVTKWCYVKCFNPRTRKGCDIAVIVGAIVAAGFNPRTRKGCDPVKPIAPDISTSFNPRTRKGCDSDYRHYWDYYDSFNPRTRKGCDKYAADLMTRLNVSIHAPVKDATSAK